MIQNGLKNVVPGFPEYKLTSLDALFCPQPRDIQCTVTEEWKKKQTENIHTWEAEIKVIKT